MLCVILSHAIVISCGDCRIIVEIIRYIEQKHNLSLVDILTTAGGSRTISFYKMNIKEFLIFTIKKVALYIDFKKYMGHNAETVAIIDHSNCGFWPKFDDPAEEERAHIISLRKAAKKIKRKYGKQIKKIILFYAVIDEKTHDVVEIKKISTN